MAFFCPRFLGASFFSFFAFVVDVLGFFAGVRAGLERLERPLGAALVTAGAGRREGSMEAGWVSVCTVEVADEPAPNS